MSSKPRARRIPNRRTSSLVFAPGPYTRPLVSIFVAGLVSCTSVQVRYPDGSTQYQSREAFAEYVEEVFRYHNGVVNDLITATTFMGESELDAESPLVRAEESMALVCRPLNDAVSATMEGRELGFFHKMRLPEAVPACEQASRRVEALLPPARY